MARFIPIDKMKQLREASKNGDERARKILRMQLEDKEDFSSLMNEYFNPAQEEQKPIEMDNNIQEQHGSDKLKQFLEDNGVKEGDSNYQEYVEDYYREFPNERPGLEKPVEKNEEDEEDVQELINKLKKEESDAIDSYSKAITKVLNCKKLSDIQKRKIVSRFKEIRGDEEEHFSELDALLAVCENIEEKDEGIVE